MWRTSSSRHEHAASSTTPRTRAAGNAGILRTRDCRAREEHDVIGEIHHGSAGVAQVAKGGGLEERLDDDPVVAPLHAHRREVHDAGFVHGRDDRFDDHARHSSRTSAAYASMKRCVIGPQRPPANGVRRDADERRDLTDGARQEDLARRHELRLGQLTLRRIDAECGCELEHRRARDAGEHAAAERRRDERAVDEGEQIARSRLGDVSRRVEKDRVIGAGGLRLREREHGLRVRYRLDSGRERVLVAACTRHGGDDWTRRLGRCEGHDTERNRGCGVRRRGESRRSGPARYGEANARMMVARGVCRAGGGGDVVAKRWRNRDVEQSRAVAEAIEVRVEAEDHTVARAHGLEQTIGERESAIEWREQRLAGGALDAVQPDLHRTSSTGGTVDSGDIGWCEGEIGAVGKRRLVRTVAVQEAIDQPVAVLGERGLRVELHADDRIRAVLDRHDLAVLRRRGDAERCVAASRAR